MSEVYAKAVKEIIKKKLNRMLIILTEIILGRCKNTSAGKSCSITSVKNSQECNKEDGWFGLHNCSSMDSNTCLSGGTRGCQGK